MSSRRLYAMVLALSPFIGAATAAQNIGVTVPPYPDGLDETQAVCVAGGEGLAHACDYGIGVLTKPSTPGRPLRVLAKRNLAPQADQASWQVTDALAVPKLRKGYALQLGGCRIDRVDDNGAVAIVRHGRKSFSRDVLWARRFDPTSGKLIVVAPARVDCANQAEGI